MVCRCGFDNPPNAKFCVACGALTTQSQGATAGEGGSAAAPAAAPIIPAPKPKLSRTAMAARIAILLAAITVVAGMYWWRTRPMGWYQQDTGGLYRFREKGKAGFMDRFGRTVIPAQFDDALDFSEGLAWVRVGKKVGFIDRAGKIVITPQFDDAQSFAYGRAGVKLCCGGWGERHFGDRYGFIDSDGKYAGSPEFLWVGQFSGSRSNDLAPVLMPSGAVGFVFPSGKVAIPASFQDASTLGFTGGPAPVQNDGKWGYIDKSGKWVINAQFDNAWNFAGGLAPVSVSGKWGYIDSNGRWVVNPQFDAASYFDNGYAAVRTGDKWGFIDKKGAPAGESALLDVGLSGNEGLRPAKAAEGWGFVQGTKFAVRPLFDSVGPFRSGLARVTIGGQEAYIDKLGHYVGDPFKGRSLRPATAVQEIWEGDVTAPTWRVHEKFLLLREGAQIKGFYTGSIANPGALGNLDEVMGEVKSDDTVRLASENGFVWKGRFAAPVVILGTRPNGQEGASPEFPLRLQFVREATPADIPPPLPATTPDWNVFLQRFKEAITQRDQASLAGMMGRMFLFENTGQNSRDDFLRQLNWQQVTKALTDGTVSERKTPLGRPQQIITDAHPCPNCGYQVALTFAPDADGQWRWTSIGYPGD
jgi:hypothetical protein